MLNLIFFLAYYQLYYEGNSKSYFQNLPFLEYGFNDNSTFQIEFPSPKSNMVFGLATKTEILEIDKHKNSPEYCLGQNKLSKIQYNISNHTTIRGVIRFKSALTPYAFTCEKSFSIIANFNFTNGKNHLDYRCQGALTYTMLFFIFISVFCLIYILSCIYIYYKKYDFLDFRFSILFLFVFVSYLILNVFTYQFYYQQKDKEYFNYKMSDQNHHSNILPKRIKVNSLIVENLCSILIFSICFLNNIFNDKNTTLKHALILLFFPVVIIPIHTAMQILENGIKIRILIVFLYLTFSIATVLIPPVFTITKAGVIVFLVGSFVTSSLGSVLIEATQKIIGTHYLVLILTQLSMLIQFFSISCFLLGLFYFKDFRSPKAIQDSPMLHVQNSSSYTLFENDSINTNEEGK